MYGVLRHPCKWLPCTCYGHPCKWVQGSVAEMVLETVQLVWEGGVGVTAVGYTGGKDSTVYQFAKISRTYSMATSW